ncbi:MAG TPA: hypothetical protein DD452_04800 [Nitrospina sp.]|nr:hypothetical protein [Nitrospina sp.]HCK67833.1 hypothetical protein [Nitrospina sp.]
MDNHFFERNFKSLKTSGSPSQDLPEILSEKISVIATSSGQPTLRFENILLHSSYDPEKEAHRFAEKLQVGARVCLYGFGLGYHLDAILDKIGPDGYLLAIELNPELLTAALTLRDQTRIFEDHRFHLIYGPDEAEVSREISHEMERITGDHADQLEVLFHAPSFKCIPASFPALTNALEVLLLERRFPAIFGNLEKANYSLNREIVTGSPGINVLKNSQKGRPGILVSAGPSLDLILPTLHRLQKEFLIACVDTTFPILIKNNIQPDYVFSLDPQIDSAGHFVDYAAGKTRLVFTPATNHNVLKLFSGERYVVYKEGHSLSMDNESAMKEKGTTRAGGSVACLGLDMMIHFGCDPIFLAGQDCAFSGNRYYSSHSKFNNQLQSKIIRMTSLEKLHREKAQEKKQLTVQCTQGNFLLTDQVMYSYLRTLEHIIQANPGTRVFNLYSHGAEIEHAPVLGSANEIKRRAFMPTI